MTLNAAARRVWSPKGTTQDECPHNGYSHAEGGVATSYPAFGAFRSRINAALASILLFAACLIGPAVSVAQVTAPGTMIRNVGNVAVRGRRERAHREFQRSDPGGGSAAVARVDPARALRILEREHVHRRPHAVPRSATRSCRSRRRRLRAAGQLDPLTADSHAGHRHRARR